MHVMMPAGHTYGAESVQVTAAILELDGVIGYLLEYVLLVAFVSA